MAKVTYGALVTELRGAIGGTVFQRNAYGFTAKNSPNMTRPNSTEQDVIKRAVTRCTQRWSNLTDAQRLDWVNYAAAFPQYAKHNPGSILSGYNVFILRNLIAEILDGFRLDSPDMVATTDSTFAPTLQTDGVSLLLTFNGTPAPLGIDCFMQVSSPMPASKPIRLNMLKSVGGFAFGSGDTDIATRYLAQFGRLPIVNEKVLFAFQNLGDLTGALFAKQYYSIIVTVL